MPSPQITSGRPCPLVLHAFGCPPTPHLGGAPQFVSKTTKSASPRFAGHTPQPMPGRFPHAPDPHTGHILIRPQSDHAPAETYATADLQRIPAAVMSVTPSCHRHTVMASFHHAPGLTSAETSDRLTQIHASNRSAQIPRDCDGGHGHGVCGVREGRCMLWSDLRPDRQSGLGARQKSGLKVPHPGNPYS